MGFKRVVAALDRSFQSSAVFDQAMHLTDHQAGELKLVSTVRCDVPLKSLVTSSGGQTVRDLYAHMRDIQHQQYSQACHTVKTWLVPFAEQAKAYGLQVQTEIVPGEAGAAICEIAQTWNADLILVGRRQYCGLHPIDSASTYLINHAPCKVMIVPF
jgi:nucleotide-binding universal stress UspA family protein